MDTNILIGRIRKAANAMAALEAVSGHQLVLCDVVVAEVLAGARNNLEYDTTYQELTTQFHVLSFTMEVSQHFRDILARDARRLKVHFADLLIAATAMAHDCALLTLNKTYFKGIRGLQLA